MSENVEKFLPAFNQFWADSIRGIPENEDQQRKYNHICISNKKGDHQNSYLILEEDLKYLYLSVEKVTNRVQMGSPAFFDEEGVDFGKPVYFKFYTSDQKNCE